MSSNYRLGRRISRKCCALCLGHGGNAPLHNAGFVLDDEILPICASLFARLVEERNGNMYAMAPSSELTRATIEVGALDPIQEQHYETAALRRSQTCSNVSRSAQCSSEYQVLSCRESAFAARPAAEPSVS